MAQDTRTALLDAAQDSLAEHGFGGTSIRDLASAVGIRESSVYKHFPSKQALLEAVVARAEERLAAVAASFQVPYDETRAAVDTYADIRPERLEDVAAGFLHAWLTDPDVVAARRVLTLEQYRSPAAGQLLRALTVDQPLAFQTELFAALMARGAFRQAEPRAVALAFWGPVLAILAGADGDGDEAEARRLLHLHLEHFTATHVAQDEGTRS